MLGSSDLMDYSFYILDIVWGEMILAEGSTSTSHCPLSHFFYVLSFVEDKVLGCAACGEASHEYGFI